MRREVCESLKSVFHNGMSALCPGNTHSLVWYKDKITRNKKKRSQGEKQKLQGVGMMMTEVNETLQMEMINPGKGGRARSMKCSFTYASYGDMANMRDEVITGKSEAKSA